MPHEEAILVRLFYFSQICQTTTFIREVGFRCQVSEMIDLNTETRNPKPETKI